MATKNATQVNKEVKTNKRNLILIVGYFLFLLSIIYGNTNLLAISEIVLMPTLFYIFYKNVNKKLNN
jgi:dolichol kinase